VNRADTLTMTVSGVLAARPAAARVFIERRMRCVGCTFAPFDTIADVARAYGMDCDELADALAGEHTPEEPHQ
jgi:hybrid cluster-associated redox disulfide protein